MSITLSFDEQKYALGLLFAEWAGSLDRDFEDERLQRVQLSDFEKNTDVIVQDLISRLDNCELDKVCAMLYMIAEGKNQYTINQHFQRMLIAAFGPDDETIFAKRLLTLLRK